MQRVSGREYRLRLHGDWRMALVRCCLDNGWIVVSLAGSDGAVARLAAFRSARRRITQDRKRGRRVSSEESSRRDGGGDTDISSRHICSKRETRR